MRIHKLYIYAKKFYSTVKKSNDNKLSTMRDFDMINKRYKASTRK